MRSDVLKAITAERDFQDKKWGTIEQHPHEVGGYLTIMRKLLADGDISWSSARGDYGALDEIRKVVAVGIACLEQHGPVFRTPKANMGCNAELIKDWRVPTLEG